MKNVEDMYKLEPTDLQEILGAELREFEEAVRELGEAIEAGDPQTIADVWLYKLKPMRGVAS